MATPRRPPKKPSKFTFPDTVLQAFSWLHEQGLGLGQSAMAGAVNKRRNLVVRSAIRLASEVRDSAIGVEAAELARWVEVREMDTAPPSPASALWLVAQCVSIVHRVIDSEKPMKDNEIEEVLEALRMFGSAVKVEPIESRVEAGRLLREGRLIERQRSGPKPERVSSKGKGDRVLRVV